MSKKNYLSLGVVLVVLVIVAAVIFTRQNKTPETQIPNISINTENPATLGNLKDNPKSELPKDPQAVGLAVDLNEVKSDIKFTTFDVSNIPLNDNSSNPQITQDPFCQPLDFDPSTTKFSKVIDENLTPSEFYEIENLADFSKSGVFQINGQDPKNPIKIDLPEPLSVTQFNFSCASHIDSVIQIKTENTQIALFKGVLGQIFQNSFSKDGKNLYIRSLVLSDGKYVSKYQIYDIVNQKMLDLPNYNCVGQGFWEELSLLTIQEPDDSYNRGKDIQICVYDQTGKVTNYLAYPLNFSTGSAKYLNSNLSLINNKIGIYNNETSNLSQGACILSVYDLTSKITKEATITQSDQFGTCPEIEIQKLEENRAVVNINN